jgi:hypothetical protein
MVETTHELIFDMCGHCIARQRRADVHLEGACGMHGAARSKNRTRSGMHAPLEVNDSISRGVFSISPHAHAPVGFDSFIP